MNTIPPHRHLLNAILTGSYTPLDVHEFVQLCYTLALPLVRQKISSGKINLHLLGLRESDVIYDCLADLFRRDQQGMFVKIVTYFKSEGLDVETSHGDEFVPALRRLVFLKVHNNIIRLYSEVDPVLGKVLRNIRLGVRKDRLFDEISRFGESYLVPCGVDHLLHLPPLPQEKLEQQFTRLVLLHDPLSTMLRKLHTLLSDLGEHRRAVPLVPTALMIKTVYALGWESPEEEEPEAEQNIREEEITQKADMICAALGKKMYATYVTKQKRTEAVFQSYLHSVREILLHEFSGAGRDGDSHYEILRKFMPRLSKREYSVRHRKIVEYLVRQAKKQMREEIQKI